VPRLRVAAADDASSLALPRKLLDRMGVSAGDAVDADLVGRTLVVRPTDRAAEDAEFVEAFERILGAARRGRRAPKRPP
jgi:antitoxin component of MazEF toxin-antitoxin module